MWYKAVISGIACRKKWMFILQMEIPDIISLQVVLEKSKY